MSDSLAADVETHLAMSDDEDPAQHRSCGGRRGGAKGLRHAYAYKVSEHMFCKKR